jgi:hypothetical protein
MAATHMNLVEQASRESVVDLARFDVAMEELVRRAKLQATELSLLIQRLERLRRDVREHLNG